MKKKKSPRKLPADVAKHKVIAVRVTKAEYKELRFVVKATKSNYVSTMLRRLGLEAAALERAKL